MWWLLFLAGLLVLVLVLQNHRQPKTGLEAGRLRPLSGKPNAVSTQTDKSSRSVPAIQYPEHLTARQVIEKVREVLEAMPGNDLLIERQGFIHAVFTTPLMRFNDDVEVYVDDAEKRVHFRSASRAGYSDMGVNRKRYHAFAKALKAAIS